MRILFVAGGTAGHVNPALAVAETVRSKEKNAAIAFVGRSGGFEKELIEGEGFSFYGVEMQGLQRKLTLQNLKALSLLLRAKRRARSILEAFSPDLVFSTGGYLGYPFLQIAHKKRIPTLLHEANAVPGLSARMCEKYTSRILLHFDAARTRLRYPGRAVTVGMPLRPFPAESRAEIRRRYRIPQNASLLLSFGGSLGAEAINDAMAAFLASPMFEKENHLYVLHGTGKREYERFQEACRGKTPPRAVITPYIKEVPSLMRAADLVVSRAGAATLSELIAAEAPALLIPSPHVTDDHQTKNAEVLLSVGAARLLKENELSRESLQDEVLTLIKNTEALQKMKVALRRLQISDTNEKIYREIKFFTRQNMNKV